MCAICDDRSCCETKPFEPHLEGCPFGFPAKKDFEISWTFGGYTTVAAYDEDEARDAFRNLDHRAILDDETPDLDIASVDKVDE